ncbi:M1 family metallopeptidase [Pedobacter sp. MW01-1-1]|uniref:M1 family metallopeptidase n=1 Tax=Pedobacter sp. MW01-1-1 TaxID=3383027 RepID=UPI003FEEB4F7
MKTYFYSIFLALLAFNSQAQTTKKGVPIENGVSLELASYRSTAFSKIQYTLGFTIPADKKAPIPAKESIQFDLKNIDQPLQIDFKQGPEYVKSLLVNGKKTAISLQNEHIIIPTKLLKKGRNKVDIQFTAGNESLNRNDEYVYALFVPERARTVFPCFDQPDLKANFLLSLTVPKTWNVLANAPKKDSITSKTTTTFHFANSDKLPTYLFSFTAGRFTKINQTLNGRNYEFLHRETDSAKIKASTDSVLIAHDDAFTFLEEWTGIKYPFQKVGFVAIPDFQFGGMEHPGAVEYKASSLFLDNSATKNQYNSRSNLISHETAHMWFGDLVTMQWFNDVWMKEVFANFMADKVAKKRMGEELFNLKFLQDHHPNAYSTDRTQGANPIRQQLDNLKDAGAMYGNIIYHKAPIMMRQLEFLMGEENFQKGIREYLSTYANKNATWPDLIAILSKYCKADLNEWNKVWVNQPGRPIFEANIDFKGGKISTFTLIQQAERNEKSIWPQNFTVELIYPQSTKVLPVNMLGESLQLTEALDLPKPLYILFNANGMGYGIFPTDKNLKGNEYKLESPLQRATAYINAYENMLAEKVYTPIELLKTFSKSIENEENEMNLSLLGGYIGTIYWNFLSPKDRSSVVGQLENTLWKTCEKQTLANNKKVVFKTFQNIYLSNKASALMYAIWKNQKAPEGIKLLEDDYTSLALTIALKNDTATSVLPTQLERINNVDRKARLSFIMPALSPEPTIRDRFFNGLSNVQNRQKEAWVGTALSFLNHPLRQTYSIIHLEESLNLLEEIQKTGDIFFPDHWLEATFGTYQSKTAYQIVTNFLSAHPTYSPRLKNKILQATDNLYRAQKLVNTN